MWRARFVQSGCLGSSSKRMMSRSNNIAIGQFLFVGLSTSHWLVDRIWTAPFPCLPMHGGKMPLELPSLNKTDEDTLVKY